MPLTIKLFTLFYVILILLISACTVFFMPVMKSNQPQNVSVYRDDRLIAEYPVDEDREFEIKGRIGMMKIKIQHEQVRVTESSCPEKMCVRSNPIKSATSQIICEPNHVVIEISSKRQCNIDAESR
jgi:hypothetical protein